MSLISPFSQNSNLYLYKGITWDNSYQDIRLFSNDDQRQTYLQNCLIKSYSQLSVVKTGKSIKITEQINNVLNANYLVFENPSNLGTSKKFYAFVTAVNYVNINTVEIEYEIDWIQTYLFDFVYQACLVEREHVNDDTFGKHTLSEGIDTGEYVTDGVAHKTYGEGIIIWVADSNNSELVGNIANCLKGVTFGNAQLSVAMDFLAPFEDKPEYVPFITMCPRLMMTNDFGGTPKTMEDEISAPAVDNIFSFKGESYTSINNKLMCYPYKFMTLDNFAGQVEQFQFENFSSGNPTFQIEGTPMPKPILACNPTNYKNSGSGYGATGGFTQQTVIYDQFPLVGWISDTYRRYMSQFSDTSVATVASTIKVGVNVLTGNKIGAVVEGVKEGIDALDRYQQEKQKQLHSLQYHSGTGQGAIEHLNNTVGFRLTYFAVKPEIAKMIDQYFTRYGYRVDVVKVPNITGRSVLNYVKTRNARVSGNIAIDAKRIMQDAMNRGVTFWHQNISTGTITNNPIIGVN